jgi:tRNA C32,U32 (ribose-2'-O)-methylase TrmJ
LVHEKVDEPLTTSAESDDRQVMPQAAPCGQRRTRIALVFGREELGLSDEEIEACDVACCIPIGRLQESLSLSHAVSIALSGIYSMRLASVSAQSGLGSGTGKYLVASPEGLAAGIDLAAGIEL